MIATVAEHKNKAYAIPKTKLEPVLRKVAALHLYDVLLQCVENCNDKNEQLNLEAEVVDTFILCNPNSNIQESNWDTQMLILMDLPVVDNWKEGNLVWFAMKLATKVFEKRIPSGVYNALKSWVNKQGFDFNCLSDRLAQEPSKPTFYSDLPKENLLVQVEAIVDSVERIYVSMWAIADREKYKSNEPPESICFQEDIVLSELPLLIRKKTRLKFGASKPIIHLFVPPELIELDIEMQPSVRKGYTVLGSEYPFVLRRDMNAISDPELRDEFFSEAYSGEWMEKWESFQASLRDRTIDIFETVDCSAKERKLIGDLKGARAVILEGNRLLSVRDVWDLAIDAVVPLAVAIWVRDENCQLALRDVLDGNVQDFHERVRQEREKAHDSEAKDSLGHNLSLVWEDPKIVPPKGQDLMQKDD